jgi:hypothetical protein
MKIGRWAATLVVAAVLVTACAGPSGDAPSEALRHDLGPLVSRFPGLGSPAEVAWTSWHNNSGRSAGPGPATYWIDAVVDLEPRRAEELRATASDSGVPSVHDALRPHLPPGPFLAGPELNAAISGDPALEPGVPGPEWTATGYLEATGTRLVLNAIKPA